MRERVAVKGTVEQKEGVCLCVLVRVLIGVFGLLTTHTDRNRARFPLHIELI